MINSEKTIISILFKENVKKALWFLTVKNTPNTTINIINNKIYSKFIYKKYMNNERVKNSNEKYHDINNIYKNY
jgi:hypothetical protein